MPRLTFSSAQPSQPPSANKKRLPLLTWRNLGVIAVGAAAGVGILKYVQSEKDAAIEKERKRSLGKASIGGSWELLDTKGNKRTSEDFKGRWCLIYFGFTHCPDVCPDELEKMAKVVDALGTFYIPKNGKSAEFNTFTYFSEKEKVDIQPLFITVDPQRDSNVMLDKYTKEFSPKLLGLTGSQQQIASVCKKFRVYFSAGPKDKDDDYIVSVMCNKNKMREFSNDLSNDRFRWITQ